MLIPLQNSFYLRFNLNIKITNFCPNVFLICLTRPSKVRRVNSLFVSLLYLKTGQITMTLTVFDSEQIQVFDTLKQVLNFTSPIFSCVRTRNRSSTGISIPLYFYWLTSTKGWGQDWHVSKNSYSPVKQLHSFPRQ